MKSFRMNRLFNARSGRCFDVAVDHGFFNELAVMRGLENLGGVMARIIDAAPDAIQLTPGQAHHLQGRPGKNRPALVLRTDVANVYAKKLPRKLYSRMIAQPVRQAVRLDAACVVVNLFRIPAQPEVGEDCIENLLALKPICDEFAMPLMVEPLVFQPNKQAGGYMVDGDPDKIVPLVRQAVELGADIIKADPTDEPGDYPRVVEVAGDVPVLVRGGGKVSDQVILERTVALLKTGIRGIVYGRNVTQHRDPVGMTRALMAVLHEDATAAQAMQQLGRGEEAV